MEPTQFNELLHYLSNEHSDLMKKFPNNIHLINGGCFVGQPAKVTDEEYKELQDIISKWRDENNAI